MKLYQVVLVHDNILSSFFFLIGIPFARAMVSMTISE